MSRRDDEPVDIAVFESRESAEVAWGVLAAGGVPGTVLSDRPPWGERRHRIQCARSDAAEAMRLLSAAQPADD
jgi:hypothetical protein